MTSADAGSLTQRRTAPVITIAERPADPRGARSRRLVRHTATVVVLVAVLAVTAVLSLGAHSVNNANEDRLLRQRAKEVAAVLTAAIPNVQSPLSSAADVIEATNADPTRISAVLGPLVQGGKPFASVAIWRVPLTAASRPIVVVGQQPSLESAALGALLTRATHHPGLNVVGLLDQSPPGIAYAFTSTSQPVNYAVYAQTLLPKNRTSVIQKNSAYFGLAYALYLGSSSNSQDLLTASTPDLPLRGRLSSQTVPFGDQQLKLVVSPTTQLGGSLLERLPWLLLVVGIVFAVGAAALTERLVRQRERARQLARENAGLYAAQRTVAQTLQHSLLPEKLPSIPGMVVGARYIAGVADIDIGGDWYDVMRLADGSVFFVVGDVSGRGLPAATIMASLRYAIRAYALQGDDPATILTKLVEVIRVGEGGHFATVLCGVIDVERHEIKVANAGHPEPILIDGDQARAVSTNIGVPVGVTGRRPYTSAVLTVPAGATLLAFTDGLVERRGEVLDVGLQRLRENASRAGAAHDSVEVLLDDLAENLPPDGPSDDVAILGVRWTS